MAGAVYAIPEKERSLPDRRDSLAPYGWPWESEYWNPSPEDRIKELAKAGALIAGEIDRLIALKNQPDGKPE